MNINNNYYSAFNLLILLILSWLLYNPIIHGFWRWDDPQILLHAIKNPVFDYYFDPSAWQQLSNSNLTPWVTFSFDIDYFLFGLKPEYFYLHHLLSLWLTSVACYFLLSLWVSKSVSLMGSLLFLCGSPVSTIIQQLMTRHYIEGLLFALTSVIFFVYYLRFKKNSFLVISVLAYALAISAKEIYVPLILLLPFIPEKTFSIRLQASAAFIIILLAYIAWRSYMLSSMIDGYSDSSTFFYADYLIATLDSFKQIPSLIMGKFSLLAVLSFLFIMTIYIKTSNSRLLLALLITSLLLLPLVPLVKYPGITAPDRYLFLVWFIISFALAWFIGIIEKKYRGKQQGKQTLILLMPFLMFFSISFAHSRLVFDNIKNSCTAMETQLRFIWFENNDNRMIPTGILSNAFWSINGLIDVKKIEYKELSPIPVFDEIQLTNDAQSLFVYDKSCQCMKDISGTIGTRLKKFTQRNKIHTPLSLIFSNNNGAVDWNFGPYQQGQYKFISNCPNLAYPLAPRGKLRTNLKQIKFFVKYISPEGWITYSPEFTLKTDGSIINWKRPLL